MLVPPPLAALTLPALHPLPRHTFKHEGNALPLVRPQEAGEHRVDHDGLSGHARWWSPQHQWLDAFGQWLWGSLCQV